MTYRTRITILSLILVAECVFAVRANAQTIPLSINGAAKCAATQSGNSFTGVVDRACQNVPPPIDTGAYTRGNLTYQDGGIVQNVDLTQMANIYGRASAGDQIHEWSFAGGSRPKIIVPPTKHLRMAFAVPTSPEDDMGFLAGSSYGSTNRPIYVRVYENGAQIFYAAADARGRPLLFNEQPWLYLVVNGTQTVNKCRVVPGHSYELELGYVDRGGGTVVSQWNA